MPRTPERSELHYVFGFNVGRANAWRREQGERAETWRVRTGEGMVGIPRESVVHLVADVHTRPNFSHELAIIEQRGCIVVWEYTPPVTAIPLESNDGEIWISNENVTRGASGAITREQLRQSILVTGGGSGWITPPSGRQPAQCDHFIMQDERQLWCRRPFGHSAQSSVGEMHVSDPMDGPLTMWNESSGRGQPPTMGLQMTSEVLSRTVSELRATCDVLRARLNRIYTNDNASVRDRTAAAHALANSHGLHILWMATGDPDQWRLVDGQGQRFIWDSAEQRWMRGGGVEREYAGDAIPAT